MHDRLAGFGGPELVNTGNQQPNKEVDRHKVFYVFCHDLTEHTVLARDIISLTPACETDNVKVSWYSFKHSVTVDDSIDIHTAGWRRAFLRTVEKESRSESTCLLSLRCSAMPVLLLQLIHKHSYSCVLDMSARVCRRPGSDSRTQPEHEGNFYSMQTDGAAQLWRVGNPSDGHEACWSECPVHKTAVRVQWSVR